MRQHHPSTRRWATTRGRRSVTKLSIAILLLIALVLAGAAYVYVSEFENGRRWKRVAVVLDDQSIEGEFSQDILFEGVREFSSSVQLHLVDVSSQGEAGVLPFILQVSSTASYDLIVGLGEQVVSVLEDVALRFPNQKYVSVDATPMSNRTNILHVSFAMNEAAAVAGALASAVSRSGIIGVVEGFPSLQEVQVEIGIRYGANWLENKSGKTINVTALAQESSTDTIRLAVAELATRGADVVFGTTTPISQSVVESVTRLDEARGWRWGDNEPPLVFSVGLGRDFDHLGTKNPVQPAPPGTTLTSVVKRLDVGVLKALALYAQGGFRGGVLVVGLADGAVGLSTLAYSRQYLSLEAIRLAENLAEEIRIGLARLPVVEAFDMLLIEELRAKYP